MVQRFWYNGRFKNMGKNMRKPVARLGKKHVATSIKNEDMRSKTTKKSSKVNKNREKCNER